MTFTNDVLISIFLCFLCSFPHFDALDEETAKCSLSNNGAETVVNSTVYQCKNGRHVPVACLTPDGASKVALNKPHLIPGYVVTCQLQGQGRGAQLVAVGCYIDGQLVSVGFTAHDRGVWYKCDRLDNGHISVVAFGCLGNNEAVVPFGSIFSTNNVSLVTCAPNGPVLPYACLFNNEQYFDGDNFCACGFWRKCSFAKSPNSTQQLTSVETLGCCRNGEKILAGSTMPSLSDPQNGGQNYTCKLDYVATNGSRNSC